MFRARQRRRVAFGYVFPFHLINRSLFGLCMPAGFLGST